MNLTVIEDKKRIARYAGFIYLFLAVSAPIAHLYIPSLILDRSNSHATAQNLLDHESLFRLGILLNVMGQVGFIFVALFLYRLLHSVNEHLALSMKTLVLLGVPITFILTILKISGLLFLKSESYTSLGKDQIEDLVLMLFRIGDYGGYLEQLFWGLWLLPFGLLVYRSGFIPKIFGVLLLANGIAYCVLSVHFIMFPDLLNSASTVAFPFLLGEIWIVLWLVIKGVREQRPV